MRSITINLYAIAKKGYSFEEVKASFKTGSDVHYTLENRLFDFDALMFEQNYPVVLFLDGVEARVKEINAYDHEEVNSDSRKMATGNVVYRHLANTRHYGYPFATLLTPARYNDFSKYRPDFTERCTLSTITKVYHPFLIASEKKQVYDELTKAARRAKFDSLHAYVLSKKAERKAAAKQRVKAMKDAERRGDGRFHEAMMSYRLYANLDDFTVVPNSQCNVINVYTHADRYSNSCAFTKWVYSYELNIRKGWHFDSIGGILTLWRGKYDRLGMPCEWMEQKGYRFNVIKGYIVRGEHIQAKSLKDAIAINKKHRNAMLADALKKLESDRARRIEFAKRCKEVQNRIAENKRIAEAYMDKVIAFNDSLASGNCRPGTQNFKDNVEAFLGKKVNTLTVREIIPLAIRFSVGIYVQRIFNHKGWKINLDDFR